MGKLKQASLMHYLSPLKADFISIAFLSLIANFLMLAPTIYMLQLYDRVMLSKNELTLFTVTLLISVLIIAMAFAEWLRSIITIKAGVRFDQSLNGKLFSLAFERIFTVSYKNTSESMQDLTNIRQFLTSNGLFAFLDTPWTLIYIAVLFILHPSLGWLATLFCLIQLGLGVWNQRSSDQPLKASIHANLENQQFLSGKVRNLETLHVMGILPRLYNRWQNLQAVSNAVNDNAMRVQGRNQHINKLARYTMQSLMLAVAALLAIKGQISVGSMIASNVLIARALQPFDIIVSTWKQFIQVKASIQRLNTLLAIADNHDAIYLKFDAGRLPCSLEQHRDIKGEITLNNLSVTLSTANKRVLNNLSVNIQPGNILTIMGSSGSGKTTLARCLMGVIPVAHGELLIDGISIELLNSKHLSLACGYLPQDIELMEGTIAENIARLGDLDASEIISAAKVVGIHDMILRMPLGYDTRIDEAGMPLSGGQRQLIGLARAVYKSPSILVLDEPNAHLDEYGEVQLSNALLTFKSEGKTVVVISHRTNILKVTDQLLVMENGEILHHGSKDMVLMKMQLNDATSTPQQQAA